MCIIQKPDSPAEIFCDDLLHFLRKRTGIANRSPLLDAADDSQFQFLHAPFPSIILYLSYHPAARRAIPEPSALLRLSLGEDDLEYKEEDHHGHAPCDDRHAHAEHEEIEALVQPFLQLRVLLFKIAPFFRPAGLCSCI